MISPQDMVVNKKVASALSNVLKEGSRYNSDETYHLDHEWRYQRTLELLVSKDLGSRMLEVGTSLVIPLVLKQLKPKIQVDVTHFDLDMPVSGKMTSKFGNLEITLDYMAVDLETTALPVDSDTYDSILCSEVLEHLDVDPMFMLSELNRVLKMGGLLVLTTPNACSTHALWKLLRGYEPYFYMQYHKDRNPYRHNYEYSKRSLESVVRAAGFDVEVWAESTFENPVLEDIERINTLGYNLDLSEMGDNLFVVAKKVSGVVDRYPSVIYV